MIYIFIHQNFPGQYRHIVRFLADRPENTVYFISQPNGNQMAGVTKVTYPKEPYVPKGCHPYTIDVDNAIRTGAAAARVCSALKDQGVRPDIIVGHCGWGETLFVKDVFPDVPLLSYFEFFYHSHGVDVGFDPEFISIFSDPSRLRARNAVNLMAYEATDWGNTPTRWQHSLHPPEMRRRITILHEGIDTNIARPDKKASLVLAASKRKLTRRDEVITYVSRNLEPYRGFHIFMRALPEIMRRRPRAQVLIVGGDGVSYGAPPPPRSTFREMMLTEVGGMLDFERVHFLGQVDYAVYLSLLQISSAHVYLTYPFVLSWSFIEAMAAGCLVIGSSTPPVLEVLKDGVNGLTVDFFSPIELADRIDEALENRTRMQTLRDAARQTAVAGFDLKTRMLPRWDRMLTDLIEGRRPAVDQN
jgi:glycosyltransferase involved in cell wall biosynthesis